MGRRVYGAPYIWDPIYIYIYMGRHNISRKYTATQGIIYKQIFKIHTASAPRPGRRPGCVDFVDFLAGAGGIPYWPFVAQQPAPARQTTRRDGDSDLDVVAASYTNKKIVWFKKT